jgi:hypothetical protein
LDEQESAHPLELEESKDVSEKCDHVVLVNTHPIDVSSRAQVAFDEEEIGLKGRTSTELVAPTRASLRECRVSLKEVVNVVQEVKRDLALLEVVQQVLICSASKRRHKLQLNLGAILEARSECLRQIVGCGLLWRNVSSRTRVGCLTLMVVNRSRNVCFIRLGITMRDWASFGKAVCTFYGDYRIAVRKLKQKIRRVQKKSCQVLMWLL